MGRTNCVSFKGWWKKSEFVGIIRLLLIRVSKFISNPSLYQKASLYVFDRRSKVFENRLDTSTPPVVVRGGIGRICHCEQPHSFVQIHHFTVWHCLSTGNFIEDDRHHIARIESYTVFHLRYTCYRCWWWLTLSLSHRGANPSKESWDPGKVQLVYIFSRFHGVLGTQDHQWGTPYNY